MRPDQNSLSKLIRRLVVDQPKGSYRQFRDAESPDFPIEGVTYPVNYGYLPGYIGEDASPLDLFSGSGALGGYFRVHRPDIGKGKTETKFMVNMRPEEVAEVARQFGPVIAEKPRLIASAAAILRLMEKFRPPTDNITKSGVASGRDMIAGAVRFLPLVRAHQENLLGGCRPCLVVFAVADRLWLISLNVVRS